MNKYIIQKPIINNIRKNICNEMKNIDNIDLIYKNQINMLNYFYLNETCDHDKILKSEINKKINGYKNQDINRNIYDEQLLISFNDVIEKLVSCKLKCYYCKKNVLLLYKNVRDELQWTLDRINNDKCHSNENTLIACLKCNIQRRRRDCEKFLFTKQLNIIKV